MKVADTLRARAALLTARGDSVAATVSWASFDTTILATADSAKGLFVGRKVGSTSIQARSGNLRSDAAPVRVTP